MGPPWARAWFILISWGHKLVWGFIYYPVLMPCFTALFTIVRGAPVLFRIVTRFCCIGKPSHTFGFPVVYSRPPKPWVRLGASLLRCGSTLRGGPLKYFWILWLLCRESLVGFWFGFSEVDRVCVAICAPLQGKTFWKPCPRLWTTWRPLLDHRQLEQLLLKLAKISVSAMVCFLVGKSREYP